MIEIPMNYPENTNIGEKRINKKRQGTPPLKSPLNGGIYSTIPLLGGVPFTAGRVPFISHPEPSFFEAVRVSSPQSVIARNEVTWQSHESFFIICGTVELKMMGFSRRTIRSSE
jgi:hypothetical protein